MNFGKEQFLAALLTIALIGAYFGISVPVLTLTLGGLFLLASGGVRLYTAPAQVRPVLWKGGEDILTSPLFYLALLTLVSFGLSSYFGIRSDKSLKNWANVCAIAFAGMVWWFGIQNTSKTFFDLLSKYMFVGLVVVSTCFITEIAAWKLFGFLVQNEWRLLTLRKLSTIVAIVLPLTLPYVMKQNSFWVWCGVALSILVSLMCGGRSGVLALSAIMILLLPILFAYKKMTVKQAAQYMLVLLFLCVAGGTLYLGIDGVDRFMARFAGADLQTGAGRLDIWKLCFHHFVQNPIFGIGLGGFQFLNLGGLTLNSYSHPHNMIVQITLETGVLGTVFISLFFLLLVYRRIHEIMRARIKWGDQKYLEAILVPVSFVAYFISAQFITSFFHGWWLVYPVLLLSLLRPIKSQGA